MKKINLINRINPEWNDLSMNWKRFGIAKPSFVGLPMTIPEYGEWEMGIASPSFVGLAMTDT